MAKQLGEDRFSTAEYYVIKLVLILTTVIVGIAFLAFAVIHAWRFLEAALK
jgi:multisubunit Na+/H+ antiporter MnhC subunit